MRHQDFVVKTWIVVVTFDPVNHVAAIARSRRADACLVNVRKIRDHRNSIADVGENLAAPVAGDFGDELLSIAGRAARVWHENDVAIVGVDLRVPTITPVVSPRALWSAMNQDHKRILSTSAKAWWLHDPAGDLSPEPAGPGDFLRGFQIEGSDERVVGRGQGLNTGAVRIGAINLRRRRHTAVRKHQRAAVLRQVHVAVGSSISNYLFDRTAARGHRVNWRAATLFSR